MSAPTRKHPALVGLIHGRLFVFLEGKPCKVYLSPFDVLLPELIETEDDMVTNVVQPDVIVFCDRGKLTHAGARGEDGRFTGPEVRDPVKRPRKLPPLRSLRPSAISGLK